MIGNQKKFNLTLEYNNVNISLNNLKNLIIRERKISEV